MTLRLLHETRPVARKPHRCSMCTGPIRPGEQYDRSTLVYDGRIYDWLTCAACAADNIAVRVWDGWRDEGVTPEDAHEWATEQVIHGDPDEQRAAKNYLERWGSSSCPA